MMIPPPLQVEKVVEAVIMIKNERREIKSGHWKRRSIQDLNLETEKRGQIEVKAEEGQEQGLGLGKGT